MDTLRDGLRQPRWNPGFAAVEIVTLALGIGANTAVFSVVQGVVLAPLPFRQPDRLVRVGENNLALKREMSVSYPGFLDWRRSARSFQQMVGVGFEGFDPTSPGTEEDRAHGAPVVIVSDRLWRNRFGGIPLHLSGAAVLACYIPARRAARLSPMVAPRHE